MKNFTDNNAATRLFGQNMIDLERSLLTKNISKSPRAVILLDEMDNANPEVINIVTNIIKDGHYNFGDRKICFRQAIIIMTTNVNIKNKTSLGFASSDSQNNAINLLFSNDFLSQIDKIIYFEPLSELTKQKIINSELDKLISRMADKAIKLVIQANVRKKIENYIISSDEIHKSMKELIFMEIRDKVSEEIIAGNISSGSQVKLLFNDNKVSLTRY